MALAQQPYNIICRPLHRTLQGPPAHGKEQSMAMDSTNRKLFWVLFTVLSFGGWFLPFGWALVEMFLSLLVSWWLVYRSGIF